MSYKQIENFEQKLFINSIIFSVINFVSYIYLYIFILKFKP